MTKLPLIWKPAAAFGGLFTKPAAAFVTVHCAESENTPAMAEALAGPGWFGGSKAGTSSHKVADVDSICEGVHRDRVAFHAGPGGNTWGIAYEFCGRASWTVAQWRAPAQLQMLRNAAPHIADDLIAITGSRDGAIAACRWLSLVQVVQHAHGLCTHNDVRLALGGTTHSDPGPNFPYAELLAYVRAELTGTTADGAAARAPQLPLEDDVPTATVQPGETICLPATTKDSDLVIALDNPDQKTVDLGNGPVLIEGCTLRIAVQRLDRSWHPVDAPGYDVDPRDNYVTNLLLGGWGAQLTPKHGQVFAVSVTNRGHIPVTVALAPHAA